MSNAERLSETLASLACGDLLAKLLLDLVKDGEEEDVLYTTAVLQEALDKQQATLRSPGALSDAERSVLDLVLAGRPLTTDEVASRASEKTALPKSIGHRSGASTFLNSLVEKELVGKFPHGREVLFTSVREAVFETYKVWLRDEADKGEVHKTTQANLFAIAQMSGLSVPRVLRELQGILGRQL
jgi:hypothetical protein